jgi:hypothetical protein
MSALDIGARGLASRALAAVDHLSLRPERFGAKGDGVFNPATGDYEGTDDTAAIMACFDALQSRGIGGTIYFNPDKVYVCSSSTDRIGGGIRRTLELYGDNITLTGAAIIAFSGLHGDNWRPLMVGGAGKPAAGTGNIKLHRCVDKEGYAITAPLAAGAIGVPVEAGAEAAFAPGDVVFIRSGQLLAEAWEEPNAELAVVAATASGLVTLTLPLSKPYEQEYYVDGPDSATSPAVTADPARYELVNVTDRVQRNVRISGLRLFNRTGSTQLLSTWGVLDARFELSLLSYPNCGWGQRDSSHIRVEGHLRHNGEINSGYGFHPSTGCTRYSGSIEQVSAGFNSINLHEGVADMRLALRSRNRGNVGEDMPALSLGARVYDLALEVDLDPGNSPQGAVRTLDTLVSGVGLHIRSCKGAIRDDTGRISFTGNLPAAPISQRGALQGPRAKGSPLAGGLQGFSGIVTHNKGLDLGRLPQYAVPHAVHVDTQVPFNGTSNRINIGWSGLPTALGNAVVVGTAGSQELVAGGATAGPSFGRQRSDARDLVVDWAGTGTPTAGRALVTVFYYIGARHD